jgi:phosphate transport system substrate-binding protein
LYVRLAEEFMDNDPDVSIAVTGGGSGTGIAALINKKTDIANSSRELKPSELKLATERGVDVVPIIFAIDALSFVVNESLPIDSLSLLEFRKIFTGVIENWSELGGPDVRISLYGRQSNSGTFTFIQEEILEGDYSPRMKQMNGTAQIIEGIKNDPAAIGYVGIGYIVNKEGEVSQGVKVLKVKEHEYSNAVDPLILSNIRDGTYPIVRPLFQYLDGSPTGKLKAFLEYELSETGQEIISDNGYFPISKKYVEHNKKYLNE